MGFRETINENRRIVTGATIGLIVIVLGFIVWEMSPERAPGPSNKAFYSDDDGAHWFKDSVDLVPPFVHNGRAAVRAYVYHWSGGDFVGYLEKYTDAIRDKLLAAPPGTDRDKFLADYTGTTLVKKPGTAFWSKLNSREGAKVVSVLHPPNGNPETPVVVEP